MNTKIQNKLDIFSDYTIELGKVLKWDYKLTHMLCAMLYTNEGRVLNVNRIKEMKDYIKKNTSMFSNFKGNTLPVISTMLSLDTNPERLFAETQELYDKMKQHKFHSSEYLTIAAMQVAKIKTEAEYDSVVKRMSEFYDVMRKIHPFVTSSDDYIYVAMLAMTDLDVTSAESRIISIEKILKPTLGGGNDMQALALVLLLADNDDEELCKKVLELYNYLKEKKYKLHYNGTMSTLGILAMTSNDMRLISEEVVNGSEYLKEKKGFGAFSLTKVQRAMFSANFVALQYVGDMKNNLLAGTVSNNITNIIIAQHMATIAATMAATTAAAGSSN